MFGLKVWSENIRTVALTDSVRISATPVTLMISLEGVISVFYARFTAVFARSRLDCTVRSLGTRDLLTTLLRAVETCNGGESYKTRGSNELMSIHTNHQHDFTDHFYPRSCLSLKFWMDDINRWHWSQVQWSKVTWRAYLRNRLCCIRTSSDVIFVRYFVEARAAWTHEACFTWLWEMGTIVKE